MKKFMRRFLFTLLLIALFGGLAGFAYLTRFPDSPILKHAAGWPVIGHLAGRFRLAYLGSPAAADDDETGKTEYVFVDQDGKEIVGPINLTGRPVHPDFRRQQSPPPEGRQQAPQRAAKAPPQGRAKPPPSRGSWGLETGAGAVAESATIHRQTTVRVAPPEALPLPKVAAFKARDWRWHLPESPVRRNAHPNAEAFTRLRALSYLPVLTENGTWTEVVYEGERGWIDGSWQPPHNRRRARRGILRHRAEPVQVSASDRLRDARKLLRIKKPSRSLGPYRLYTDVEDEELLDFLDQAAAMAEDAYFARFGRLPSGDPLRSAVLFRNEADYRTYSESFNIPLSGHSGHAGRGVLAFFAEGGSRATLAATLVHEIGHLLNDRALAYRLPPWLEEGMAEELSALWLEEQPDAADQPARRMRAPRITKRDTSIVHLHGLLRIGSLPTIGALLGRDRDSFYGGGVQSASYSMSGVFIRFLLDGADRRYTEGFRKFLGRIAAGTRADLLKALDAEPAALERGFRAFVETEFEAVQARYPDVRFE